MSPGQSFLLRQVRKWLPRARHSASQRARPQPAKRPMAAPASSLRVTCCHLSPAMPRSACCCPRYLDAAPCCGPSVGWSIPWRRPQCQPLDPALVAELRWDQGESHAHAKEGTVINLDSLSAMRKVDVSRKLQCFIQLENLYCVH